MMHGTVGEKGVSQVIGFVMILMIVAMLYSTFQAYVVPSWIRGVEMQHLDTVYSDIIGLKSTVSEVALKKIPASTDIHLGVKYPELVIFATPVGATGTIYFDDVNITIEYETPSGGRYTEKLTSVRIIYEFYGSIGNPKIIYEHGIVSVDWGHGRQLALAQQSLIVGGEVYIPVLSGSLLSESMIGVRSLEIHPYTGESVKRVKWVKVSIETKYPELWQSALKNTPLYIVNVEGNNITIRSDTVKTLVLPSGRESGDLVVGFIKLSPSVSPIPPYTNVDTSREFWPSISDICIKSVRKDKSVIYATVRNVTSVSDVYADLSDITKDPAMIYINPDSINVNQTETVDGVEIIKEARVNWTVTHPEYGHNEIVCVGFWAINSENNMQYYTLRAFYRLSKTQWANECS